jgi:hypothetical protein
MDCLIVPTLTFSSVPTAPVSDDQTIILGDKFLSVDDIADRSQVGFALRSVCDR